jgi:hypothetical protein
MENPLSLEKRAPFSPFPAENPVDILGRALMKF